MKFKFKDQVVCTDPFYKALENPAMPEGPNNPRIAVVGEIIDYNETEKANIIDYLVSFEKGPNQWINEDYLQLYSDSRLT